MQVQQTHLGVMRVVRMVPGALFLRYPNVQVQAVLGELGVRVPHLFANESGEVVVPLLVARVRQPGGVQHSTPWVDGHRSPEPERAHRRLSERNARIHPYLAVRNDLRVASHHTSAGQHHRDLVGVVYRRPAATASTATSGSSASTTPTTTATVRSTIGRRATQDGRTTQQQRHCTGVNAVDAHFSKYNCANVGVLAAATAILVGSTKKIKQKEKNAHYVLLMEKCVKKKKLATDVGCTMRSYIIAYVEALKDTKLLFIDVTGCAYCILEMYVIINYIIY